MLTLFLATCLTPSIVYAGTTQTQSTRDNRSTQDEKRRKWYTFHLENLPAHECSTHRNLKAEKALYFLRALLNNTRLHDLPLGKVVVTTTNNATSIQWEAYTIDDPRETAEVYRIIRQEWIALAQKERDEGRLKCWACNQLRNFKGWWNEKNIKKETTMNTFRIDNLSAQQVCGEHGTLRGDEAKKVLRSLLADSNLKDIDLDDVVITTNKNGTITIEGKSSEKDSSIQDYLGSSWEKIKAKISDAWKSVSHTASDLKDQAYEKGRELKEKAGDKIDDLKDKGHDLKEKAGEKIDEWKDKGKDQDTKDRSQEKGEGKKEGGDHPIIETATDLTHKVVQATGDTACWVCEKAEELWDKATNKKSS